MILTNELLRLKASLGEKIKEWMDEEGAKEDWQGLDTHISNNAGEYMAEAAFAVLLSQSDLTRYYEQEKMLKK